MTSLPPSSEPDAPKERRRSDLADLWGDGIGAGFTAIPNALIRAQKRMGLTANDMVVLLNLLMHRWHDDSRPFPRPASIANRSGLGTRTIQRSLSHLAELGLITRQADRTKVETTEAGGQKFKRQRTRYDLTQLREKVEVFARHDIWYRPAGVEQTPGGRRAKEQASLGPNPSP